jgi:YD repeat-containing protein
MSRLVLKLTFAVLVLGAAIALVSVDPHTAESASGTATISYDSVGQVVQDSYPAASATYDYDNAGNRTTATLN